ncbi:MAG TPA: hypothetical protein VK864_19910 [Longimicrobiales bacterium]|nr:hypothetical protein [Longimicrobiales bacterium]
MSRPLSRWPDARRGARLAVAIHPHGELLPEPPAATTRAVTLSIVSAMRILVAILCVCATLPTVLHAQKMPALPEFEVGSRVRVWPNDANAARFSGRLLGLTADSLRLEPAGTDRPQTLALSTLERIEQSEGRNRLLGAGAGLAVGGISGLVIARIAAEAQDKTDSGPQAGIILAGAGVGGVIGFLMSPERWRTIWQR